MQHCEGPTDISNVSSILPARRCTEQYYAVLNLVWYTTGIPVACLPACCMLRN